MVCPRCQIANPHHAAFCLNCGFKLELLRDSPSAPQPNLRKGLGVASLVIGLLSLLTCSLFFVGALAAMATGVIAIVKANSNPDEYGGKGMAIAGIALSVLSLVGGVVVFFRVLPNYYQNRMASNEWAAYGAVKHVGWCEARFFEKHTRFGTVAELIAADLLEEEFLEQRGYEIGYRIEVRASSESFEIIAVPAEYGTTGRWSLYMTTDYMVRIADKRGREANLNDQPYY